MDSDDYVELNLVQELISAMDQFGVDLVTCADDQSKLSDTEYDVIKVDEYDFNANYQHPISWGVLYKTALIRDLKFALDLYVGEDSLFIAQAINRCDTALMLLFLSSLGLQVSFSCILYGLSKVIRVIMP